MSPVDYPAHPRRSETRSERAVETLRVFVAVFPPPSVIESLTGLRRQLEASVPGFRWVRENNLHFTLRFFGDITRKEAERAGAVLDEVAAWTEPFHVELSGLGVFPSWKRPRVLWVGCEKGGAVLQALARSLERGFRDARLGKTDKPFVPHLTVGRWRDSRSLDLGRAQSTCEEVAEVDSFTVTEVCVVQSHLGPKGSTYVKLHTALLGRS